MKDIVTRFLREPPTTEPRLWRNARFAAIPVGLSIVWSLTGLHIIDEAERGVVLRFGEYRTTLSPGLHWRMPWPIDRVEQVDTGRIELMQYEDLMLTQDENIVAIDLAVQYRRSDARAYLFSLRDPEAVLRDVTVSAIREVVGKNALDFILTHGRTAVAEQAHALIQGALDRYDAGLEVRELSLLRANFPEPVEAAVQDTLRAQQDKALRRLEAQTYANRILPRARGAAARRLQEAKAYKVRVVADAAGEADRFLKVLGAYRQAPQVTRERLYLETLEEVFARSKKVVIDLQGSRVLTEVPFRSMLERPQSGEARVPPRAQRP